MPARPNFILILVDDLGYGDLGCYGHETIKTPYMDSLARRGLRFTDFHSNGAMCSPTRAALLTGRYQQRCGIQGVLSERDDYETGLPLEEVTFAEVLKTAGYATGIFGKWHLGYTPRLGPLRQGFNTFGGLLGGDLDYHSHFSRSGRPDWWKQGQLAGEPGYTTELTARHAVRFIEENRSRPFCLYVPFQAVHFPFQGPKDKGERVHGGDYWSNSKYGSRLDRAAAFGEMVEALDEAVGQIASAVRRNGLEERTLIFLTSDNGGFLTVSSNRPLRGGKGQLWEGGHRVPGMACWQGTIQPGVVTEVALTMDLFPTMAALAGARLPDGLKLDGVSLLPLLKGERLPERTLFWRTAQARAARRGPWKLLIEDDRRHLFDLSSDIGESKDVAGARPELVRGLERELSLWEQEVTAGVEWIRK